MFFQLTQHFGLKPGLAESDYDADDILDSTVLRQASVYGTLAVIFTMLAGGLDENKENFWKKQKHYRKLFEKSRQRCRVSIDQGADGVSDTTYSGASARLRRD